MMLSRIQEDINKKKETSQLTESRCDTVEYQTMWSWSDQALNSQRHLILRLHSIIAKYIKLHHMILQQREVLVYSCSFLLLSQSIKDVSCVSDINKTAIIALGHLYLAPTSLCHHGLVCKLFTTICLLKRSGDLQLIVILLITARRRLICGYNDSNFIAYSHECIKITLMTQVWEQMVSINEYVSFLSNIYLHQDYYETCNQQENLIRYIQILYWLYMFLSN